MPLSVYSIRERINLFIYKIKEKALLSLRILRLIMILIASATIIYFIGFPQTLESKKIVLIIIRSVFIFLIFSYMTRLFFDFEPKKFLRDHKYEGYIIAFLFLNYLCLLIVGESLTHHISIWLGMESFSTIFITGTCALMLGLSMMEVVRGSKYISSLNISPPTFLIGSFILLILFGTGLLMLPEMTTGQGGLPFLEALFTSTSASCVTGLTVIDVANTFTVKGKVIMMILIQLGGLNIITFTSFFALFSQGGVGLRQQAIIMDFMSFDSLSSTKKLLKDIFLLAIGIEIIGAIAIFMFWSPTLHFASTFDRIFASVFHSVSAFNNAGFSTFSNSLNEANGANESYIVHLILACLVLLGGLGFHVIKEIFSPSNMRERMEKPWKTYSVGTKLVLYSTAILILVGMVFFYFGEINNPEMYKHANDFGNQSTSRKIITSFLHSIATRSGGFNSIDFSLISTPTILIFMFLMFIGASPGSTGGGIKTTTFATLFLAAQATIRNKSQVHVFQRTISKEIINKAFTITIFSISVIFLCVLGLTFSDPEIPIDKLAFEVISAYCTVGLSLGITAKLSVAGKVILILCMFIGRIGILTLAFSLSRKSKSNNYSYPNAFVMVG